MTLTAYGNLESRKYRNVTSYYHTIITFFSSSSLHWFLLILNDLSLIHKSKKELVKKQPRLILKSGWHWKHLQEELCEKQKFPEPTQVLGWGLGRHELFCKQGSQRDFIMSWVLDFESCY